MIYTMFTDADGNPSLGTSDGGLTIHLVGQAEVELSEDEVVEIFGEDALIPTDN